VDVCESRSVPVVDHLREFGCDPTGVVHPLRSYWAIFFFRSTGYCELREAVGAGVEFAVGAV
jgi:hypothetical protein